MKIIVHSCDRCGDKSFYPADPDIDQPCAEVPAETIAKWKRIKAEYSAMQTELRIIEAQISRMYPYPNS